MNRVSKINTLLTASNTDKVEALCHWIDKNYESIIGWEQLSSQSGLTHTELITLFQIHKHQTPMAYIRQVREQKKKQQPLHPQHYLFNGISKQVND